LKGACAEAREFSVDLRPRRLAVEGGKAVAVGTVGTVGSEGP